MAKRKKTPAAKHSATKSRRPKTATGKTQQLKKAGNQSTGRFRSLFKSAENPLPSTFNIFKQSLSLLRVHWRLFLGITAVYAGLNILLVRGIGGGVGLTDFKATLQQGIGGEISGIATGATLFSYLLISFGGVTTETGSVYQALLAVVVSLAVIWALRQVLAGKNPSVGQAFYRSTYPLIPFTLVLIVVGLQLIPLLVGGWLYGVTVGGGIAVTGIEKLIWSAVFFFLAVSSLYMICSSLFALYIATLPDMSPMNALRSARQLVRRRRWVVLRKILFLPLALLFLALIIMLPFLIFATPIAEWVFFFLSIASLTIAHSYMYNLYRSLL